MAVCVRIHHTASGGRALGGVTRILIIDDDHRPGPPGSGADAVSANGVLRDATEASAPALLDSETRPVVHEYQMLTPLPVRSENAENSPVQLDTSGTPDVSVVRELIARVEELLHRTRALPGGGSAGTGSIRFGSVMVEPATQTVLRGGQPVRVTHTEFRLLLALIRRRGAIASRIELLREVWGAGAAVSRRAVDTHIARLRRKLEDDPANPRHILTALAWGYRFRP